MFKQDKYKWIAGAIAILSIISVLGVYGYRWYYRSAREAVPASAALVADTRDSKGKLFLEEWEAGRFVSALLPGTAAGARLIRAVDEQLFQKGLWMVNQTGEGQYGLSGVIEGPAPALAERISKKEAEAAYRGCSLFTLENGLWVARYRNLWLIGQQSRQVEAMIAQLEDKHREWALPAAGGLPIYVRLENLPAFFSGYLGAVPLRWLQAGGAAGLRLGLPGPGPRAEIKGQLLGSPTVGKGRFPLERAGGYLPRQLAWCVGRWLADTPQLSPMASAYLRPWAGAPYIQAQLALPGSFRDNQVLLLPVQDARAAQQALASFAERVGQLPAPDHPLFPVHRLLGDQLFSGLIAGGLRNPYGAVLGEYIAFTGSRVGMEQLLNTKLLGLGLRQAPHWPALANAVAGSQPVQRWSYLNHDQASRWAAQLMPENASRVQELLGKHQSTIVTIEASGAFQLQALPRGGATRAAGGPQLLWQLPLEKPVLAGPFAVDNHIWVQYKDYELVSLNLEGIEQWSFPLSDTLKGSPAPLWINEGQERGSAFLAGRQLFVLDSDGRPSGAFPLSLPTDPTSPLLVSQLEGQVVTALIVGGADARLYGYDQAGAFLPGWAPGNRLDTLARQPLRHAQHSGKDYFIALSEKGQLHILDREGAPRLDSLFLNGQAISPPYLQADSVQQRIAIGVSGGYAQVFNFSGATFRLSLLPEARGGASFLFSDVCQDRRGDYIMWSDNTVSVHAYEGAAFKLQYRRELPAPIDWCGSWGTQKPLQLGLFSSERRRLWALSGAGEVIARFPVAADAPPAVLAGRPKPTLAVRYEQQLYLYEL